MGWLRGCRVLVTGGGKGIGRAVVQRFVAEGAHVVVFDRDAAACMAIERESNGAVASIVGSVARWEDNLRAVSRCIESHGGLDVFVGNAGVFDFFRPLAKLDGAGMTASFRELFETNVMAYLLGARAALEPLRASRGSMIFTASSSSFYAGGGGPLYVASKHAVLGVVRQLAYELAPDVRVNGVAPGGTVTSLAGLQATGDGESRLDRLTGVEERMAATSPLGVVLRPEDHTGAYVLLAAAGQSRGMTGNVIHSDGGWEVRRPRERGVSR